MQLKNRIKQLEKGFYPKGFYPDVTKISDEELERIIQIDAGKYPNRKKVLGEIMTTLSDVELELICLGKDSQLSPKTLRRLDNANTIKN